MVNRVCTTKKKRVFTLCFLVITLYLLSVTAFASHKVLDKAELFYQDEKRQIEEVAAQIDETYQINVLVLTDQERNGKAAYEKAEEAYEAQGYADNAAGGGFCILIDIANREVVMFSDRIMMRFITDDREEAIYDKGYSYLSDAEYGDAMISMLEKTADYLKKGIPGDQYHYDSETGKITRYYSLSAMDVGIAFGGALLVPFMVTMGIASGYKKIAKYKYDLNTNAKLKITGSSDRFVNQFVTKRRINTGSSGGGKSGGSRTTTHRSASGRTYGGGHGRKF